MSSDSSQTIMGRVIEKYKLANNNIGVIVEDEYGKKYSIEFQAYTVKPKLTNLYGLISDPFYNEKENIEHLINKDDHIGVVVHYSKNPIFCSTIGAKPLSSIWFESYLPHFDLAEHPLWPRSKIDVKIDIKKFDKKSKKY